jgi:hypothetical protein
MLPFCLIYIKFIPYIWHTHVRYSNGTFKGKTVTLHPIWNWICFLPVFKNVIYQRKCFTYDDGCTIHIWFRGQIHYHVGHSMPSLCAENTLYSWRQAIQPLVSCPDEGGPKYKSSYWATVHPNFPPNNRTQAVRNYEMTVIKSGVPVRTEDVNGHQIMSFTVTRE